MKESFETATRGLATMTVGWIEFLCRSALRLQRVDVKGTPLGKYYAKLSASLGMLNWIVVFVFFSIVSCTRIRGVR